MIKAPFPPDEAARIAKLKEYEILDTLSESSFDDLTALAAYICKTPIALISLVDETRQWFKSAHGLDAIETSRDIAFCAHTILTDAVLIVPDSSLDQRFTDNPLATGEPHVKFYAGAPLITSDGQRLGSLCVIDHVARSAQEEIVDALQRLARQVVAQMDLRLKMREEVRRRRELKSANELLLQSRDEKSNLLATMSHEIRTPMAGIVGLVDELLASQLSIPQKKSLKIIAGCTDGLVNLVSNVLDLSKLEAGKMELDSSPFKIAEVVDESVGLFAALAKKKHIALVTSIDPGVTPVILGDRGRVSQILRNLIGNAIKFTDKGEIRVGVSAKMSADENSFVVQFAVRDTGPGISPDDQSKLFKAFSQVDGVNSKTHGGTGLGLSISHSLCRKMGGQMQLESFVGAGSTFSFNFPTEAGTLTEPKIFEVVPSGERLRILLADDSSLNLRVTSAMLSKLGHDVVIVNDGDEVLEVLDKQKIDLVLIDKMMPKLDGIATTREIVRRWPSEIRPPVIGFSASASDRDRDTCLAAGMIGFISKPVRLEVLADTIQKYGQKYRPSTGISNKKFTKSA